MALIHFGNNNKQIAIKSDGGGVSLTNNGSSSIQLATTNKQINVEGDSNSLSLGLPSGAPGKDGASAYEIAVENGFKGTEGEWLASLRGKDGRDGIDGKNGTDGYTPVKNKDYFDGRDGVDGITPVKGIDYFDGKDGYIPVKGEDYFTEEEVDAIIDEIYSLIGEGKDIITIPGEKGDDGGYYFPAVNDDGFLSWQPSLDDMPIPAPAYIKGKEGAPGKDGYTPIKGIDYFDGAPGKDGKDGYTPIKGKDYFDGRDGLDGEPGYTPKKGIDYFDGKDGKDGYTPRKGIDYFDGENGKDGKTPVKGIDYFDGKDGYTPIKGKDYFDGEDGYTPIKGIDYFDGKDGENGKDGYTPVKGVDYFDGKDGRAPIITIRDGYWYIDGSNTNVRAEANDGEDGEAGAPGASVEIIHISQSTEDGGSNIITFSDGKTITIKNGNQGKPGLDGNDGKDATDGLPGKDGKDGYTPIKGVDYFTDSDIANIITEVLHYGDFDGKYQNKTDYSLNTEAKTIVEAINEINDNSVDNITSIETWIGKADNLTLNNSGISWKDTYEMMTTNGWNNGVFRQRLPIVAGNNVSITIDDTNKVFKISANGNGNVNTGAMKYHTTSLNKNSTLKELIDELRDNNILATDRVFLHWEGGNSALAFSDAFVKISDAYAGGGLVSIEWLDLNNPVAEAGTYSTSSTIGTIIQSISNKLFTDRKDVVGAINEVYGDVIELARDIELTGYQLQFDNSLLTNDKSIVGAINELKDSGVSGISSIDTYMGKASNISPNLYGITYKDSFEIFTSKGTYTGTSYNRLPIVAGDNITFTVDDANKVIRVNSTGGSASGGGDCLPSYSAADEGKFLKIVNGAPAWEAIEDGDEVEY